MYLPHDLQIQSLGLKMQSWPFFKDVALTHIFPVVSLSQGPFICGKTKERSEKAMVTQQTSTERILEPQDLSRSSLP